jgi:hypothetical protein
MTDEQINAAIAEACGTLKWSYALPVKVLAHTVSDYCNDLNAMHEAEKVILNEVRKQRSYLGWLG